MSDTTKISYCDHTWSPWLGCEPVSLGCAHCYASAISKRAGRGAYRHGMQRTLTKDWKKPRRWNDQALGQKRVLVSMCDPFDDDVPVEWHIQFYDLISDTPNLTWLLLTKRPEEVSCIGQWPDNVWMGVSIENQETSDHRTPILFRIPAKARFLSVEPMLGPINLQLRMDTFGRDVTALPGLQEGYDKTIDWVIVGGESGFNHRKLEIEWMRSVVNQCKAAGVKCYVKQDSDRFPGQQGRIPDDLWNIKEFPNL